MHVFFVAIQISDMAQYCNIFTTLLIAALFIACDKDDETTYDIPETYEFENVSYSGQQERLAMLLEMKIYMARSRTLGQSVEADRLKAMFRNEGAAGFQNDYEKQLFDKTFEPVRDDFVALMDELAVASQSTVSGSEDVSGVIETHDGTTAYLVGEDGIDHAQVIEKGLMGACFYYQATSVYLGEDRMNVDNEEVIEGRGTAMEHHWDEAFGYFGVPRDFPVNLSGLFFWGDYSNKRNALIGSNEALMDALIKGRAAITNNDLTARDKAISEVRLHWEGISAATAIHYINAGIRNFDDMARRSHGLSEAIGFVYSLQFNPEKRISNREVGEVLELIAGSSDLDKMDLYQTRTADLEEARSRLADLYDMADIMEQL